METSSPKCLGNTLKWVKFRECWFGAVVVVVQAELGISMASVKVPPIHRVRLSNAVRARAWVNVRPVRRTVTHVVADCSNSCLAWCCAESIVAVLCLLVEEMSRTVQACVVTASSSRTRLRQCRNIIALGIHI